MINKIIDIVSYGGYPACELSNFCAHEFKFRGFPVSSMEGFLQGLKFQDPILQGAMFLLVGYTAKSIGSRKTWANTLWWQGSPIRRFSKEYQDFIKESYQAMFDQNKEFREALLSTGEREILHTIGHNNTHKTVITAKEFCTILTNLRK